MLQVEWEGLPRCSVYICAPLAFDLHCDWMLRGSQDPESITMAQVGKTPPTHLKQTLEEHNLI